MQLKFDRGQKVRVTAGYAADSPNVFAGGFQASAGMEGTIEYTPEDRDFVPDEAGLDTYSVDFAFPAGAWDVFTENEIDAI